MRYIVKQRSDEKPVAHHIFDKLVQELLVII